MKKWVVARKQYKGKNCLGEKIYHVWFYKTKTAFVCGIKVNMVLDSKIEIVLE